MPAGTYSLTIPGAHEDAGATGDLDITGDLAITGAGADTTAIDGGGLDRVFHIVSGAVEVSAMTVRNGSASDGAGIFIEIDAVLAVVRAAVTGNRASGDGGGIFNDGAETLVERLAGTVTVAETTVAGNTAGLGGGGIANSGNLTVLNSTITSNSALHGGGIVNFGSDTIPGVWGTATVTNTTVSGNSASFAGGGLGSGGWMMITNVTIANNSAPREAGISTGPFGGATLKNTIVAKNSGGDCTDILPVASAGHNLDSDGSCGLAGPGDLSGVEPLLAPLADNGGVTATHALLAGSPAIDAGDDIACPPADQRGEPRPADGDGDGVAVCDIGAYEASPLPLCNCPTPSVSETPGPTGTRPRDPAGFPQTGGGAPPASRPAPVAGAIVGGLLLLLASRLLHTHLMPFAKEVRPVPGRKRPWP
ncbi:MAG: choice-of-anchor Q domain-containing protein [Dehalococcoidia bacterium]|nr:choice-of-anchor Q domain-containing protein [Dehalococcoidia bacterium]